MSSEDRKTVIQNLEVPVVIVSVWKEKHIYQGIGLPCAGRQETVCQSFSTSKSRQVTCSNSCLVGLRY